jgi:hypothetical protein
MVVYAETASLLRSDSCSECAPQGTDVFRSANCNSGRADGTHARVPVNVVSRTTQAVDYRHHSGGTSIDFRGTDLMPEARGHARVESRTGRIEIDTDFDHLRPSRSYGPQYLTYVLWAITPEGRPQNLGEIVPKDGKSSVKVSTDLQAFGLIVTAEPYFAVTRPRDVMILENEIKKDTKGLGTTD